MVVSNRNILIDSAFIFENIEKAFLGAPMIMIGAQDNTFSYGVIRDFLRIHQTIGINNGVIAIGKEALFAIEEKKVQQVLTLIKELQIPCVYEPGISILEICARLSSKLSHIITQNKKLLHLANNDLTIIFPNNLKDIEYMSPDLISAKIGVPPEDIPTFLSLTQRPKSSGLTKFQAVRLIELYRDINGIYDNLPNITAAIRKKLSQNEEPIRLDYTEMSLDGYTHTTYEIDSYALDFDNEESKRILKSYGFFSLTRLLKSPKKFHLEVKTIKEKPGSYFTVVTKKNLKKLESALSSTDFCSVDTETDDKNPQHASLLGISFSVKQGEAYFIPMIAEDLKDFRTDDVFSFLKKIFRKPTKFIGHNIKYDYLLLRKHGIKIKNVYFDTMLAAFDCFGDWTFFNLKYLANKLLGKTIKSYKEIVGKEKTFLELPLKKMAQHACEDADITLQLFNVLNNELKERGINKQYFNDTLPMVTILGDLEFYGISLKTEVMEKFRDDVLKNLLNLKSEIFKKIGKEFDIDSLKELEVIIKHDLDLQKFVQSRKLTLPILEQLGVSNDAVKLIVYYKRYWKQLKKIDSILKAVKNKKIYPIFNQIKSSYGQLSSTDPNLFDDFENNPLKNCFEKKFSPFFRDKQKSFDILTTLVQDFRLIADRENGQNIYLKSHPKMKGFDKEDFMLKIIIGYSDAKLCKLFMIDRLLLSTLCHDIEMRYPVLFKWLEDFKKQAVKQGYADINNKRKYFEGLKSSNIEKKNKAINLSIRWLIKY